MLMRDRFQHVKSIVAQLQEMSNSYKYDVKILTEKQSYTLGIQIIGL